jgi:hypothetical protein
MTRALVFATLVSSVVRLELRADDADVSSGFRPLFNGRDLTGWKPHPRQPGDWRVEDGKLIGSGPKTSHLYSLRGDYKDFHLRVEARINDGGNSGVFVRASPNPALPANNPAWPDGYEAQINSTHWNQDRTGSLRGGADGKPVVFVRDAPVPAGRWFELELIVEGNRIVVVVDHKKTAEYIDENRLYASGHIVLQQMDPQTVVEFRKISIREIVPVQLRADDADVSSGFRPLFNGRDQTGWSLEANDATSWGVEDGAIVAHGQDYRTRSYLVTDREYADFVLRLEFNLSQRGGSGIGIRAIQGEVMPRKAGPGFVDHPLLKLVDSPRGTEQTGSSYWLRTDDSLGFNLNPDRSAEMNPAGSWNTLEVEVKGRSLRASVNGKPVLNMTSEAGATFPDGSLPGLNRVKGRIGLQKHTGTVRFRNIQIKELTSNAGPSLYVLSIGINDYPDKRLKLDCAAPDARDIRQAFLTHSRRQFPGGVEARMLLDAQATRANILEGLQWLAGKAKGNDVAVVFYAGHGDSQIEGQFYLVPFDANLRKLGATGVSGESLRKALGDLPCTTMLILDACDSGGFDAKATKTRKTRALPTATDTMLRQMVNDEGLVVMCGAAKGKEAAEENGHGFFTRAIVEGLSGKADFFKKGRVELYDLQAYVKTRVGQLSGDEQEPTISIPSTIRSFSLSKP